MKAIKKDFIRFEKEIKEQLEQRYEGKGTVSIRSVWKNNGVRLRALSVVQNEGMVAPTIYLDDYYDRYCRGMSIESIVHEMTEFYENDLGMEEIEVKYFMDFESVKDTLRIKLVNYLENVEFLRQVPYCRFLDFAVVCYSHMKRDKRWDGMIMVCHSHLKMWQVSEEEVFACALENSQKYAPEVLFDMSGFMNEIDLDQSIGKLELEQSINEVDLDAVGRRHVPNSETEMSVLGNTGQFGLDGGIGLTEENMLSHELVRMYVLTNKIKIYGASVLYYPDVLKKCACYLKSNFYILPSSIHEVILLPDTGDCVEELLCMVREVNDEQVGTEEKLSYNVYYYDGIKGCLKNMVTQETVTVP